MPTRYHLGTQAPATADAAGIMAALAALFAVSADVDTAAAVSGVMTWTRDTTAGSQAIYSSAFGPRNSRIIIAVHDSGTPTPSPTMVASADTYTAANILIGLCDDAAGAYAGWNQAAPFSGCTFAGYYRLAASAAISSLRAMLSSKDVLLQVLNGTTVQSAHAGAVLKTPTGYCETDGFRYGLTVSGVGDMSSTFRSNAGVVGAGAWGKHTTTNGSAHWGVYAVGSATWVPASVSHIWFTAATADSAKFDATTAARIGIAVRVQSAPLYSIGSWLGVTESALGLTGQNVTGASDTAVRWSASSVTTAEEAVLVWRTYS